MDKPFFEPPKVTDPELLDLLAQAKVAYDAHFDGSCWLGRCIFLSFYCSLNTCDFCFRSVADKRTQDPKKAMRSLGSILTEALLIRAFGWRIEFLTGGYGITEPEKIKRYVSLVKEVLGQPIWLNLGVLSGQQLSDLAPDIEGVVASLETLEPKLHKKTCPDKPIEPYVRMLDHGKELGLKRSITLVIGLGEERDHWRYVESFLKEHALDRITIYALRPVLGTPYTKGPTSEELAWWIAKVRVTFPTIEIIAGTAEYRLPEITLLLEAGANALTKLPATKLFNTQQAKDIEQYVQAAGRQWASTLTHDEVQHAVDWDALIDRLSLSDDEKEQVQQTLARYLKLMGSRKA